MSADISYTLDRNAVEDLNDIVSHIGFRNFKSFLEADSIRGLAVLYRYTELRNQQNGLDKRMMVHDPAGFQLSTEMILNTYAGKSVEVQLARLSPWTGSDILFFIVPVS